MSKRKKLLIGYVGAMILGLLMGIAAKTFSMSDTAIYVMAIIVEFIYIPSFLIWSIFNDSNT